MKWFITANRGKNIFYETNKINEFMVTVLNMETNPMKGYWDLNEFGWTEIGLVPYNPFSRPAETWPQGTPFKLIFIKVL